MSFNLPIARMLSLTEKLPHDDTNALIDCDQNGWIFFEKLWWLLHMIPTKTAPFSWNIEL